MSLGDEERFMRRAHELALRGTGRTAPNPLVGAVVVSGGEVAGEGHHEGPGREHAEVAAIAASGERSRSATLFLNLEPCCHHGMTPPCTDAIVAAGISRVVFSIYDPDERVMGRGARRLEEAGIEVETGMLAAGAVEINLPYIHRRLTGRPFVVLKLALTLDGRLSAGEGYLTGEEALDEVHRMRASLEAVAVGSGTVAADDPELDRRRFRSPLPPPVRIVLDSEASFPPGHRWLESGDRVIVCCAEGSDAERTGALVDAGAEVAEIGRSAGGLDLAGWVDDLGGRGIGSVLVEGGTRLATSVVEEDIADRLVLFHAPLIAGGGGGPWFRGDERPGGASGLVLSHSSVFGQDTMSVYDSEEVASYLERLT